MNSIYRSLCFIMLAIVCVPFLPGAWRANQKDINSLSLKAQQALAQRDWVTAVEALEKLAQLTPDVPEVQGNLGLAYYSQNKVLQAREAFARAVKLNPKMSQARVMVGLCDAELGRYEEAIAVLEPAFRHPADKEIGRLIGLDLERAYAALHSDDRATNVAEELVKRYPDDPEILFQVSRLFASRSYGLMRTLMQEAPDSIWVHYANADVDESLQRYDQAITEYHEVLALNPHLPEIHFKIGRCLLLQSRNSQTIEQATQEFERELANNPQSADAEYEVAEILRERNQFEPALTHFTSAVQYQQGFVEAEIGLARTLIALGRQRDALPHLKTAARLDTKNGVPHYLLSSVYKSLGDSENQRKEMDNFRSLQAPEQNLPGLNRGALNSNQVTPQTMDDSGPQP